ncbi:NAD(P)/FAD-dependent oxidoreductase [Gilvimarinus agarilyticus]|uniref:NAD(P)/FAD-dependent oxidoreductase n=1 Tax=unclassified Gilvimarinus TaxID=2642066 RepID=UPI001C09D2D4|nr:MULTISPECIES: NAD(P)/FAD-dependent oxidoreductase [unclassified Gilvimarinus]MBU2886680.1 NAD(P)/FAD-dependent oxidoreductase [Gilvimarinus agarilyticus]MDO6571348.1 NAD(P)/FAD-dependent oxidoreductase [Gilvimarinus sp. 2_MG-2023]MDO6746236.1 NAD(P)/FAD-dependent oxidoreductase [Gilvimarinus sp. 1_MG-2023]
MKKIVVVGGGAGGLELVTKLGRKFGRKGKAHVTLVDRNTTHVWKPLLHEIAVGTMDEGVDAVSYRAHAFDNHFQFRIGTMTNIDRAAKQVILAPMFDDDGQELLPETRIDYDILVLAMGSSSNDFNTPGVKDHCIFLDGPTQAHRFRNKLLGKFLRIQRVSDAPDSVNIAIIGGGATGVELSAELHHAVEKFHTYGFDAIDNKNINVTLIEAGPRILPALPERISTAASRELAKLGVNIKLNTRITSATTEGLHTADNEIIASDLMVWAAGVKVTDALKNIGGIETNRINQLPVNAYLQIKNESSLFAIGDCAEFIQADGTRVPPRAQSAHQMADVCFHNISAQLNGGNLKVFRYKDHGSLVSLANYSTVGSLMGNLSGGSLFLEGRLARLVYVSLYRMHQIAIHGYIKTALVMLSGSINRWLKPKLKLH